MLTTIQVDSRIINKLNKNKIHSKQSYREVLYNLLKINN